MVPFGVIGSVGAIIRQMSKPMADANDEEEGKEQRCQKCGYNWTYSGELWTTTCPRCNGKTKTWKDPDMGDDVLVNKSA